MNSFVISEQNSSMLYVKMATNVLLDKVQTDWMGYLKKKITDCRLFFFMSYSVTRNENMRGLVYFSLPGYYSEMDLQMNKQNIFA